MSSMVEFQTNVLHVEVNMMGRRKALTSNLQVVKELCRDLEGVFEAFEMDKVWSEDGTKVTVAFTAEKLKPGYKWK